MMNSFLPNCPWQRTKAGLVLLLSGLTLWQISPAEAFTGYSVSPDADAVVLAESAFEQRSSAEPSAQSRVSREDFYVESAPGIQIFVRKVRLGSNANGAKVPVLLVHGGGAGGLASFDLDVSGYSLAENLATAGHPVYVMDVRGWGKSTRPPSMNKPVQSSPSAVPSEEAVRDISAVVDAIRSRNSGSKVALIGWATGGHWSGMYTTRNNEKVSHLVILNSIYGVNAPWKLRASFEDKQQPGTYDRQAGDRLADAEGLLASWNQTIPVKDKTQWREPAVAEAYVMAALKSDPTSSTRTPTSMRIPGTFRKESYKMSLGKKYWNAADIRVPTLVIRGELDHWSRQADSDALKAELANSPRVRAVTFPQATHFLFIDRPKRGRDRFLKEVLPFLSNSPN